MEDVPSINTYNFFKPGFADPPTDYYFRPYFIATRNDTDDLGKCYLDRPAMEVIAALKLINTLNDITLRQLILLL